MVLHRPKEGGGENEGGKAERERETLDLLGDNFFPFLKTNIYSKRKVT